MAESVMIADDHPIFRRGLREVLDSQPRFSVVAETGDGAEALRLIREHRPRIAVLDINMPGADGLDVLAQANRWPDAPIFVMLTMYTDEAYFRRAMDLGAMGYLLKDNAEADLIACLDAVCQGRRFLSPGVSWQLAEDSTSPKGGPLKTLTPTELRILKLIAEYKSSREIGELLSISHRTVQNHRANIASKLELKGTNALLKFALEHQREI